VAKIVISSLGNTGDHVPFVALAKALRARGHLVLAAINEAMAPLFQNAGIEVVICGRYFGPEDARYAAVVFDAWQPTSRKQAELDEQFCDVLGNYRDLLSACRGADLLIAGSRQEAAHPVYRTLLLSWICVHFHPGELVHEPKQEGELCHGPAALLLLASSSSFSRPALDLYPRLRQTGFWFYDGADQPGWSGPSPELESFVQAAPAPLLLLPGSSPVADPGSVVAVHAEAAARLGCRLIIQEGWAELVRDHLPPGMRSQEVFFAKNLPHDWLLQRSAAVITPGATGVVARALRAGCPVLAEPLTFDQLFNARRLQALGVGAAMHPYRLTADGICQALEKFVLTERVKTCALDLRKKICAEDGVATACALIEHQLNLSRNGGTVYDLFCRLPAELPKKDAPLSEVDHDSDTSRPVARLRSLDNPVFVLAAGWCAGTRLLQHMMHKHCLLWSEPTDHFLPIDALIEQVHSLCRGPSARPSPDVQGSAATNADQPGDAWHQSTADCVYQAHLGYFANLFRTPALAQGFARWGFTDVRLTAGHAGYLRWLFPHAKILLLFRDPYECYRSVRISLGSLYGRRPDFVLDTPERFAHHWRCLTEGFVADNTRLGALILRYEDLLRPEFDCAAINAYLEFDLDAPSSDYVAPSTGQYEVAAIEFERVRAIVEPLAARLGYAYPLG
jgi:UDP:flavonoid glycosyltransferase YjiC (YdhE family)